MASEGEGGKQGGVRRKKRRLIPVTCTLRPHQIKHIDTVCTDLGERSRWIRDAIDKKILAEAELAQKISVEREQFKKGPGRPRKLTSLLSETPEEPPAPSE